MPPAAPGRWTVDQEEFPCPTPGPRRSPFPPSAPPNAEPVTPPLVMVTAYDAPGARIADAAGVDIILVGDSVANNVLGYEDTLQVTVEDMAHHTAAVARARPEAADRGRPARG